MCSMQRVIMMSRYSLNSNLHLYHGCTYQGMPIQADKGPFIEEYLDLLNRTMQRALAEYPRVFAFRVDLRFPACRPIARHVSNGSSMRRFLASFNAKIDHDRKISKALYGRAHACRVRYVWAREVAGSGCPHYHLVIFLNQDAFFTLGRLTSGAENMFRRLEGAWASALGVSLGMVSGLIEIPINPAYRVRRDDIDSQKELFYRASYLCKSATKNYGDPHHSFGASRL